MIRDVLAQSGSAIWPSIILVVLFILFMAIVVSVYRGARNRFARESRLPLEDETAFSPHPSENEGRQTAEARRTQP